jgi:Tol biopolymer transport system component
MALTLGAPAVLPAAALAPSRSVGSDRVLVTTQDSSGNAIVATFLADGTAIHAVGLPNTGTLDYDPTHRLIALVDGEFRIQVVGSDGGNLHQVLDTSGAGMLAARWRPGQPQLAVLAELDDGLHVFVVDAITGSAFEPTGGAVDLVNAGEVTWSPDGTSVVLQANLAGDAFGTVRYFRIPVAGGAPTQLALDSGYYSSPAAGRAYLVSGSARHWNLVRLNADLGGATAVGTITTKYQPGLQWSADGTRFLVVDGVSPIQVRAVDGRLIDTIGDRGYELVGGAYVTPSISPNGKQVILSSGGLGGGIWVEDLTNQYLCQISKTPMDEVEATWSPDGSYVLLHRFGGMIGTWADTRGAKIVASPSGFNQTDFVSFEAPTSASQADTHPCPRVRVPRTVYLSAPVHHGTRTFHIVVQDEESKAKYDCTRRESVRIDRRVAGRWHRLVTVRTDRRGRATYQVPDRPFLHYRLSINQRKTGPFSCLADSTTIYWGPPGG